MKLSRVLLGGMNSTLQLTHTRVGDIPLLLALLINLSIPEIYDREVGDHGLHTGLSGGWLLTIWLVFILTESDHTKYKVEDWVERHQKLLSHLTGRQINAQEFNDNRLSALLKRLSKRKRWHRFEAAIWQNSIEVYEILAPGVGDLYSAHLDSTTVSGYHRMHEDGVMQRGHSKDHRPDLPQLKLMTAAMHPHGHLAASTVESGNTADDSLYLPLIARVRQMLGHAGVLYVGDSKMAALATRAQIACDGDYYLTVAPMTGQTAKQMSDWIDAGLSGTPALTTLNKENGERSGRGYEFVRQCTAQLSTGKEGELESFTFSERVPVIQSGSLAQAQSKRLEKRLAKAAAEIAQLTPEPTRGRRQYRAEEEFNAALKVLIEKHNVTGLLEVDWEMETQTETRLVGRGRAGANRPTQQITKQRCQVKSVKRDLPAIAEAKQRLGWRVQLSNAPISLETCVSHYRGNWRGERNYHRLKDEPIGIDPLFVRKDDQIIGLTHLLTLAARVESLIEVKVEQGLKSEEKQIKGLYPGLPNQATDHPTTVAMLKAIDRREITLTEAKLNGQTSLHLSPLPEWLADVLRYLHLSPNLYADLQKNSAFDISIFGK